MRNALFYKTAVLLFLSFMGFNIQNCLAQEKIPVYGVDTDKGYLINTLKIYQNHISAIDGHRCPMFPSCSVYALKAIKKHGYFKGWIMACDRLMRCGRDEIRLSPLIVINGRKLTYDPLCKNDFWWKGDNEKYNLP